MVLLSAILIAGAAGVVHAISLVVFESEYSGSPSRWAIGVLADPGHAPWTLPPFVIVMGGFLYLRGRRRLGGGLTLFATAASAVAFSLTVSMTSSTSFGKPLFYSRAIAVVAGVIASIVIIRGRTVVR
jgi:hypothetical protein